MWGDTFYSAMITPVPPVTLVLHGLLPLHPLYITCVASQYDTEYHLWEEKQEEEDGKGKKLGGGGGGGISEQGEEEREMKWGGGGGRVQGTLCFADKLILVEVFSVLFCV